LRLKKEEGNCGSKEEVFSKNHQIQIQHDSGRYYPTRGI
jgi:hypothetical protein